MTSLAVLIGRGLLSARPAAGTPGSLYYATDTTTLYRDNGASWDSVEGAGGLTNPMTTAGDLIVGGASGTPARLAAATDGEVLTLVAGAPAWAAGGGGAAPSSLLAYSASTDLFNGSAITNNAWTNLIANQNFTIAATANWVSVSIRGAYQVIPNSGAALLTARAVIDSGGTPSYYPLGSITQSSGGYCPVIGEFKLTGLAAGAHTIGIDYFALTGGGAGSLYLRAATQVTFERMAIDITRIY